MSRALILGALAVLLTTFAFAHAASDETAAPLAPFARLIGGQWHTEGSYQVFEWAVGRQGVRARSYVTADDGDELMSEGLWYWHPGEQALRGTFVASDMGIHLFDYLSTHFEGDTIECALQTYGGEWAGRYDETWVFSDDDHYVWTLTQAGPDGPQTIMTADYERRRE